MEAIGAPSKSGLWFGHARVVFTESVQKWNGSVHHTTGQIDDVWVSHGNELIRCHSTQFRWCSEREVSIASLKRLVRISLPTSVSELTSAVSPWTIRRFVHQSANSRRPCVLVRWIRKNPKLFVTRLNIPLRFLQILAQWSIHCETLQVRFLLHQDPVSASVSRDFDVPVGESPVLSVTMETSPRELTRSQSELVRGALQIVDPMTVRRRVIGKRTIIEDVEIPEAREPSERRSLLPNGWIGPRERSRPLLGSQILHTNEKCRNSTVWLGNRLKVPFTVPSLVRSCNSMRQRCKSFRSCWLADAVRRLSQEEELNLKPERLLRMLWLLVWKHTEGGDRRAKACLIILVHQHPELTKVQTAAPTNGKMSRPLLLQAGTLHKLQSHVGDVSSAF